MFPLVSLPWWGWLAIAGVLTQIIIALVTVYFHRAVSHRAVTLAPSVHRVCRFLSWFLIAMVPQEFAAVHRKHHAKCDTAEDPHSPANHGWYGVVFGGLFLYRKEIACPETIAKYGQGMEPDPLEPFYRRHPNLGIFLFALGLVALGGWVGLACWLVCMAWIPFWAAGVINGLGHHVGYRRYPTEDLSTNLIPWGLWVGGEELHNNHHAEPSSPKFSKAWYEVDLGWGWIRALQALGLAQPRAMPAPPASLVGRLLHRRYEWLGRFQASLSQDLSAELGRHGYRNWKHFSRLAQRRTSLRRVARQRLDAALQHPALSEAHRLEQSLKDVWNTRRATAQQSLAALEGWIHQARMQPWPGLRSFCEHLAPTPALQ